MRDAAKVGASAVAYLFGVLLPLTGARWPPLPAVAGCGGVRE